MVRRQTITVAQAFFAFCNFHQWCRCCPKEAVCRVWPRNRQSKICFYSPASWWTTSLLQILQSDHSIRTCCLQESYTIQSRSSWRSELIWTSSTNHSCVTSGKFTSYIISGHHNVLRQSTVCFQFLIEWLFVQVKGGLPQQTATIATVVLGLAAIGVLAVVALRIWDSSYSKVSQNIAGSRCIGRPEEA